MEIYLSPPDRSKVTLESMVAFLADMVGQDFIDAATGVRHVSYDHWDPGADARVGDTFESPSLEEAIDIIREHGVEFLSLGLKADSHYEYKGYPEGRGKLTTIMYCLNNAAAKLADHLGEQIQTDYYFGPTFQTGRFSNREVGDAAEVCTLTLPGEGGNVPFKRMDECMGVLRDAMREEGPEFEELIALMSRHFGEVSLSFGFNEF